MLPTRPKRLLRRPCAVTCALISLASFSPCWYTPSLRSSATSARPSSGGATSGGYLASSSAAEYMRCGMHGQVDVSSCTSATSSSFKSLGSASAIVNLDDSPLRTCGADSARPPRYLQPKRVTNPSNRCRLRLCLVKRSAGFSSPNTFRRSTLPVLTACWIQRV